MKPRTTGRVSWPAVVALALQVGVNYANDYSDGIRGTDDERVASEHGTYTDALTAMRKHGGDADADAADQEQDLAAEAQCLDAGVAGVDFRPMQTWHGNSPVLCVFSASIGLGSVPGQDRATHGRVPGWGRIVCRLFTGGPTAPICLPAGAIRLW